MSKKLIIIIVIAIVLVAGIGYLIYFFYKNTSVKIVANPDNAKVFIDNQNYANKEKIFLKPGTYQLKVELDDYITYQLEIKLMLGAQKVLAVDLRKLPMPEKVTNDTGKFPALTPEKKSIYYLSNGGKTIFSIEDILAKNLITEPISPNFFANVTNINWSPDMNLAIVKEEGSKTFLYDFKRYDLLHQEFTPFDDGIGDVVWSPDSQNIIYYYAPTGGETTLIRATETNTEKDRIYNFLNTNIRNPQLSWSPDGLDVLLVSGKKLYILNLYTKELIPLFVDKNIIQAEFSPTNKILLVADDGTYLTDKNAENIQKLDFKTTLNKITFFDDNNLIIVEKNANNIDNFYFYNLQNNQKNELVYNAKSKINPVNAILTSDKVNIYFESSGFLYRMKVDDGRY